MHLESIEFGVLLTRNNKDTLQKNLRRTLSIDCEKMFSLASGPKVDHTRGSENHE